MDRPTPQRAVLALATFVRECLSEVGDSLAPLFTRREAQAPIARDGRAGQPAIVVVAAAAPFAPTSYARARLLRQLHATGRPGECGPDSTPATCSGERSA